MNLPSPSDGAVKLFCQPSTVTVPGGSVESVGIDLGREHCQVGKMAVGLSASGFEYGPKSAAAIY